MKQQMVLRCSNMTKYFGGMQAVRAVTLAFDNGSVTALMGPNGAGKTTLLNMMTGHLRVDEGSVDLDGRVLTGLVPYKIARLGMVRSFQITHVFQELSVRENLRLAADATGAAYNHENLNSLLVELDLDTVADEEAHALSGGQQRLLELGMCIMQRPQFVLLDEPFAGLNPRMVEIICRVIKRLDAQGAGVVVVSHDIATVVSIAERIVMMSEGEVIADGAPSAVLAEPQVVEAYMGTIDGA